MSMDMKFMNISLGRGTGKIVTRVREVTIFYLDDSGLGNIDPEDMIRQIFGPSVRFSD